MDPIEPATPDDESALWPDRIRELGSVWREGFSPAETERAFGEIWILLNLALKKYVRMHGRGPRSLSPEDISDIAAEKASELARRLDTKSWNPSESSSAELRGFLATIARNGVVDWYRGRKREVPAPEGFDVPSSLGAWGGHEGDQDSQSSAIDGATYARAIAECAAQLSIRARRAFNLRVFYELASTDIARDPDVATTPAGVDAMLARCREHMRGCLSRKGLSLGPLPPGTFVRLWELTQRGAPSDGGAP